MHFITVKAFYHKYTADMDNPCTMSEFKKRLFEPYGGAIGVKLMTDCTKPGEFVTTRILPDNQPAEIIESLLTSKQ